jgi:HlyD family secretion protein
VQRDPSVEATLFKNHGKGPTTTPLTPGKPAALTQGVYLLVMDSGRRRAKFVPVATGVTGTTDIEVLNGLKPGDEIVTGTYKTLRILKGGTAIKVDNSVSAVTPTDTSS